MGKAWRCELAAVTLARDSFAAEFSGRAVSGSIDENHQLEMAGGFG